MDDDHHGAVRRAVTYQPTGEQGVKQQQGRAGATELARLLATLRRPAPPRPGDPATYEDSVRALLGIPGEVPPAVRTPARLFRDGSYGLTREREGGLPQVTVFDTGRPSERTTLAHEYAHVAAVLGSPMAGDAERRAREIVLSSIQRSGPVDSAIAAAPSDVRSPQEYAAEAIGRAVPGVLGGADVDTLPRMREVYLALMTSPLVTRMFMRRAMAKQPAADVTAVKRK